MALLIVATGALIYAWSRSLFGNEGALVSLILFAFCPTILAHGVLVTSDMMVTFFLPRRNRFALARIASSRCLECAAKFARFDRTSSLEDFWRSHHPDGAGIDGGSFV